MFKTICVVILGLFVFAQAEDKSYHYEYTSTTPLVENSEFFKYDYNVEKTGPSTFLVKGSVEQLQDLTEDMEVQMVSYHKDVGAEEWVETKFKGSKKMCEFMAGPYKAFIYPKFKDTVENLPHYDTCPVPKATYIINETQLDCSRFKSMLVPGDWKIVIRLMKNDEIVGGVEILGTVKEDE